MFSKRIQRARKAAGLSLRGLAQQVGLSHAAVKKYEDGQTVPSSNTLIKLAQALQVKVEYFFRPESCALANLQYRKHADIPKKDLDAVTAVIMEQIERRLELESLFPVPPRRAFSLEAFNLPSQLRQKQDIEQIAAQVRQAWNLGANPIPDLVDTFESQGIRVFALSEQKYAHFNGLSAIVNNTPVIVVGSHWPGDRQRFTLSHELGHLLLEKRVPAGEDEEKYCDHFAGAFLLPKETLIQVLGRRRHDLELRELSLLKEGFGISMLATLMRAREIEIIGNDIWMHWYKLFKQQGWLVKEPGQAYPAEKFHHFEHMVFHALAEDYITESKAAELMNISLAKFKTRRAMECPDAIAYQ